MPILQSRLADLLAAGQDYQQALTVICREITKAAAAVRQGAPAEHQLALLSSLAVPEILLHSASTSAATLAAETAKLAATSADNSRRRQRRQERQPPVTSPQSPANSSQRPSPSASPPSLLTQEQQASILQRVEQEAAGHSSPEGGEGLEEEFTGFE